MSAIDWTTVENALQAWVATSVAASIPAASVIWIDQSATRPTAPWISLKLWGLKRDGIGWVDTEPNPLTFAPIAVTGVTTGTPGSLTAPTHGLSTGDGPIRIVSSGTIPAGLAASTDYWVVAIDANTLQLASTFANAIASSPVTLAISGAGSGTITVVDTPDTVHAGAEVLHVVRCYYSAVLTIQCYADTSQPTGPSDAVALVHECQARSLLPSVRNALEAAGIGMYDFGEVLNNSEAIESAVMEPRAVVDARIWLTSEVSEPDTIIDNIAATSEVTNEAGDVVDVNFTVP